MTDIPVEWERWRAIHDAMVAGAEQSGLRWRSDRDAWMAAGRLYKMLFGEA